MSSLTGTATLLRMALRRDRVKLPAWVLTLGLMAAYFATALETTYPDDADLAAIVDFMAGPAGVVMTGPGFGFDDPDHAIVFAGAYGLYLLLGAGLMNILLVARHTRAEEETGRLEMLLAGSLGRHAVLSTVSLLAVLANLALALLTAASLASVGYDLPGALLFGSSVGAVGLAFAGVTMATAQIAERVRSATGLAGTLLGVAVAIRGAGDVLRDGGSPLSWLSPLAWAQQTRVFVDGRAWPLLLCLALFAGSAVLAAVLADRRDVGAGLLGSRPGHPQAGPRLAGPRSLALRLERGHLVGWAIGIAVAALMYGSLASTVEGSFADLDADLVTMLGGDADRLVEGFLGVSALMMATVVACYAILAVHRLSREEGEGRAEVVLATAVGRGAWWGAAVLAAASGGLILLSLSGLVLGLGAAGGTGEPGWIGRMLLAQLAYAPAVWLVAAVAGLCFAVSPRLLHLAWALPAHGLVVGYFGEVLGLPSALIEGSLFAPVPRLPIEDPTVLPVLGLTALAALVAALGVAAVRRREVPA